MNTTGLITKEEAGKAKFTLYFKNKPIRVYTISKSLQKVYDAMQKDMASECVSMYLEGYCQRSKNYTYDNYNARRDSKLPFIQI